MEAIKKEQAYDVVITMTSEEAKMLCEGIGNKSDEQNEKYFEIRGISKVLFSLFEAIDEVVK